MPFLLVSLIGFLLFYLQWLLSAGAGAGKECPRFSFVCVCVCVFSLALPIFPWPVLRVPPVGRRERSTEGSNFNKVPNPTIHLGDEWREAGGKKFRQYGQEMELDFLTPARSLAGPGGEIKARLREKDRAARKSADGCDFCNRLLARASTRFSLVLTLRCWKLTCGPA